MRFVQGMIDRIWDFLGRFSTAHPAKDLLSGGGWHHRTTAFTRWQYAHDSSEEKGSYVRGGVATITGGGGACRAAAETW